MRRLSENSQIINGVIRRYLYRTVVKKPGIKSSGLPRNFVRGVQQIQLRREDTEKGDLGGSSPLVRASGGNCNLVQEISFHIVKFS